MFKILRTWNQQNQIKLSKYNFIYKLLKNLDLLEKLVNIKYIFK